MKDDHRYHTPPPRPKLLFIHSGSPKKRLTFEAAAALGIDSYLLTPQPNWAASLVHELVCTRGCSRARVLDLAADLHSRVGLDGVVTFWEEDVPTAAVIARHLGLRGLDPVCAMSARSKLQMRRALRRAGVPVPAFAPVDSQQSLRAAVAKIGLPAILKPEFGADSEWVTRVTDSEQAAEVLAECQQRARTQDSIWSYPRGSFILEGYLEGPEVSVEGVVQEGHLTLYAIIDKDRMTEPSFIERGETTPSRHPTHVQEQIRQAVAAGVSALGLTNSGVHAEVRITAAGPRIIEIGARMGGDCIHALVKRVYGIDLAEQNLRVALGWPVSAPARAFGVGLSRTLVPEQAGRLNVDPRALRTRRTNNLIEVVFTKQPGDAVLVPPDGYDNLAWISVWGADYRAARRSLTVRAQRLEEAFEILPPLGRALKSKTNQLAAGG